jgi:malonyl-CoA/methylmalonyl-CoA synthetase
MTYKSFVDFIGTSFQTHSRKTAITFLRNGEVETQLSYGQLQHDASCFANYLISLGLAYQDPVMLYLPKSVMFAVSHIAIQEIGAISVPINPEFKQSEIKYLIDNTRPKIVIAGKEQAGILRKIQTDANVCEIDTTVAYQNQTLLHFHPVNHSEFKIDPNDPAIILYTSGTTGNPKGAILNHKNLVCDANNIIKIWQINPEDTICHTLPFFHTHGLCFAFHTLLAAGGHIIMLDRFEVESTLKILMIKKGDLACTIFMAVPAMYNKLIARLPGNTPDFSHMRLWASGSAPLLPKDFERIRRTFGKSPVEREGMTETGMNFSNPLMGEKIPGSIGLPLPGLEVKIVDPKTYRQCKKGQAGEIWLKGPAITPGYWRNEKETEKAFVEGWFRTGDIGRVDQKGYYYLIDRIKDIIISGGENISPKEVEIVLNQMEEVRESAVVGIPDEKWGEKVVAAVSLMPGKQLTAEGIIGYCKDAIHAWKVPKEIRFVKELPKNRMGKVLRDKVRAIFTY